MLLRAHGQNFIRELYLKNIYTARASIQKHGTAKCLAALTAQMIRAFDMNPKVGGYPLRSRYFLSKKVWHFHKTIRSCVENDCCCPRTVNICNVNSTSKIPMSFRLVSMILWQSYDWPRPREKPWWKWIKAVAIMLDLWWIRCVVIIQIHIWYNHHL